MVTIITKTDIWINPYKVQLEGHMITAGFEVGKADKVIVSSKSRKLLEEQFRLIREAFLDRSNKRVVIEIKG